MNINKIAYIAPEIPALSATFVYNEIISLQNRGYEIFPVSVHKPDHPAVEPEVRELADSTYYLYNNSVMDFILTSIKLLFYNPVKYTFVFGTAVKDSFTVKNSIHTRVGIIYRFLVSAKLAFLLKKRGCQHIHAHFAHIPSDLAMYASMLSGIPFSFTSHANDLFERGWLLQEKCNRASSVITISEYNKRFLESNGVVSEKINIVRCGVSPPKENSGKENSDQKKRKIRIGTLGRLVEKKGFDVLLNAVSEIDHNFILEIAGDGPLLQNLKGLGRELNISEKIKFKGAIPHNEVYEWLTTLDIFILACKKDSNGDQDGIPVVLMEAMSAGLPVLSTNISGIPELIENGISGLLADPDDPLMLMEKLKMVLYDEKLAKFLSENAKERIRTEFGMDLNADRLINVWEGKVNGTKE